MDFTFSLPALADLSNIIIMTFLLNFIHLTGGDFIMKIIIILSLIFPKLYR